jgi:cytochrome P450
MAYEVDSVDVAPVTDWVNDWDWLDDQWGANAINIWNSVRDECPMASTERYGRAFMPVTMDAVAAVAKDTENFSSIWVNVGRPDAVRHLAPPITSDPPEHHGHRCLLLPAWNLKVGYVRLLILAGVDTTWSAIGSGLWHFAQNPDQVARLVAVDDDDMLWQTASEEVLRYYAPVTMARKVINDTEIAGCPVRSGDQMLLTFPAANHDPEAFDTPGEFQLDRAKNRHVAFGLGIHRCVGSNLARLELLIALQEWVRAFPNYALDVSKETTWANGQIRGPRNVPVLLNR